MKLIPLIVLMFFIFIIPVLGQYTDCNDVDWAAQGYSGCEEIIGCQTLNSANTYYLLTQSFSFDQSSCIQANRQNITLDLNNYTITSNTVSPDNIILAHCGYYDAQNFEIKNGKIIENGDTTPLFGENGIVVFYSCSSMGKVHDMYFETHTDRYPSITLVTGINTSVEIYNNIINKTDTHNNGNDHLNAGAINTGAISDGGTILVHDNILYGKSWLINIGGPINFNISNNLLYPTKYTRNPYTIRIVQNPRSGELFNNTIISDNSRGILIEGDISDIQEGYKIHGNYVDVAEQVMPGLDGDGTHGLRMRPYPEYVSGIPFPQTKNHEVYDNTIIARSKPGNYYAYAGRFTALNNTQIYNNTFIALSHDPAESEAVAGMIDGFINRWESMSGSIISGNTFISNMNSLDIGQDSGPIYNGMFISNKLVKTGSYSDYYALRFGIGDRDTGNIIFRDTEFLNGSSRDQVFIHIGGYPTIDYTFEWYLNINVEDTNQNPLTGAQITILNITSQEVFSQTTDFTGQINNIILKEFRRTGTQLSNSYDYYTPHNITVTYNGKTQSVLVNINESKELNFVFSTSNCTLPQDYEPCDCINNDELLSTITSWYDGQLNIAELITNIKSWKSCN